jgi:dTDP-4-dehydrorhamnose 3,5-epimerase-like enzyme
MLNHPTIIEFNKIGDPSLGYISVAEVQDNIPFEIKRVYWTYYTPDHVQRGGHAHKKLQQVLVAVSGIIELTLKDSKGKEYFYKLEKPSMGLFIPENYWRDLKFSHNAVLVCLASEIFKEEDYIRDFSKFIK